MTRRSTAAEFVAKARAVHGGKYDYSRVEYAGRTEPVEIVCPEHGPFLQKPHVHLAGHGCPACGLLRRRETSMARYGAPVASMSAATKEKARATCVERYGGPGPQCDPAVLLKSLSTKCTKLGVSDPEAAAALRLGLSDGTACIAPASYLDEPAGAGLPVDDLHHILQDAFGPGDVVRSYWSRTVGRPFSFYIRSRDLLIDFLPDGEDLRDGPADMNYVAFHDELLRDAAVWDAMGRPDGRDFARPYSWLPDRLLCEPPAARRLTGTPSNLSIIAKRFQFGPFYARERALWAEDPMRDGLPLRVWLYHNRLYYTGKAPQELSDLEVLRGFRIAGLLRGYTSFDAGLMDKAVARYGIRSVYDPCAGWGERALYCRSRGLRYEGVDINGALLPGYDAMRREFGMEEQSLSIADAAEHLPEARADAVVTCPPYGGTEIYSGDGAENLDDGAFLDWWDRVVGNCGAARPRYFCLQVNQRWRDRMAATVEAAGYAFLEEFRYGGARSSHFTRKGGKDGKREFECMLVFERKVD